MKNQMFQRKSQKAYLSRETKAPLIFYLLNKARWFEFPQQWIPHLWKELIQSQIFQAQLSDKLL